MPTVLPSHFHSRSDYSLHFFSCSTHTHILSTGVCMCSMTGWSIAALASRVPVDSCARYNHVVDWVKNQGFLEMGHIKVSQKMTQSDLSGESCVIGMSDGSATTPLLLSFLLKLRICISLWKHVAWGHAAAGRVWLWICCELNSVYAAVSRLRVSQLSKTTI